MRRLIALLLTTSLAMSQTIVIVVPVAGGGGASTLMTGLIGYWKMDEASGNRMDSSGNTLTSMSPSAAT